MENNLFFFSQSIKNEGATGVTKAGFQTLKNLINVEPGITVMSSTSYKAFSKELSCPIPVRWIKTKYRFGREVNRKYPFWKETAKFFLNLTRADIKSYSFPEKSIVIHNHIIPGWERNNSNGTLFGCYVHGSPDAYEVADNPDYSVESVANLISKYDFLIFLNSENKESWEQYITIGKYFIIPNTIDENRTEVYKHCDKNAVKEKVGFSDSSFNICVTGTVTFRKGQDRIFENIRKIVSLIPNVKFHFVGELRDAWSKQLQQNIESSAYKDNFVFHGFRNNPLDYVFASDCFLLASRAEGQPLAVLEAMALGIPILVTDFAGIKNVITHDKSGFIIEQDKIDTLHEYLYRIYSDKELGQNFSNFAYEHYISRFSNKSQQDKIKAMLASVRSI